MKTNISFIWYLHVLISLISYTNFSQQKDSLYIAKSIKDLSGIEIPFFNPTKESVIHHFAYSLLYNENHGQASWVAYTLNKNKTSTKKERTNRFLEDPQILSKSATARDYKNSGYDRGHLAPAADMTWHSTAMKESFYYSNISPQIPAFNRGIWKKLENIVRNWSSQNEHLFIITGPVLEEKLPVIGKNKISIPKAYYKIILAYNKSYIKTIGFLIPNKASKAPLETFVLSIDEIETKTQLNFFHQLPDNIENSLEKLICIQCWKWQK